MIDHRNGKRDQITRGDHGRLAVCQLFEQGQVKWFDDDRCGIMIILVTILLAVVIDQVIDKVGVVVGVVVRCGIYIRLHIPIFVCS